MKTVDRRLNRMIEIADELEIQLDQVVAHMGRCDTRRFRALSTNPAQLLALMGTATTQHRERTSPSQSHAMLDL